MDTVPTSTGIPVIDQVTWGTHACLFYETQRDLLDVLTPFFHAGLENHEFCLYVAAEPVNAEAARRSLPAASPDFERNLPGGQIEIVPFAEWFSTGGRFDFRNALKRSRDKLDQALAQGYAGLRFVVNPGPLPSELWDNFIEFEHAVDARVSHTQMMGLCAYSLNHCSAGAVLDVVRQHQLALARRNGVWEELAGSARTRAHEEIRTLNAELERRVEARTALLAAATAQLGREIGERRQAEGQLRFQAQLLATVHDAIVATDVQLAITSWNPGAEALYGWKADEVLGRTTTDVLQTEHNGPTSEDLRQSVLATGEYRAEVRQQRKDGSIIPIESIVKILRDESGQAAGLVGVNRDITARKQAEAELRRQTEILQTVFDHLPAMISFTDPAGHVVLTNREWERTLGWTLQALQAENLDAFDACYPDPAYRQKALDFVAAATGEWTVFKATTRAGRVRDIDWARFRLEDGSSFGIGLDVTERQRLEDSLRAAQARAQSILASIVDTHVILDREWRYTYVNQAALEAIGRPREQILGQCLWDVYPGIVGTELEWQYRRAMDERLAVVFENHHVAKGAWWEHRFYPAPEGLAVFATDITERKRVDLARAQLAAIVESSDDAIFSESLDGIILSWNRGAQLLFGYSAGEVVGRSVSILVPPDRAGELAGLLERLGGGERIRHHETTRLRKDGAPIDVAVTLSPIRDAAGQMVGASAITRNISERKRNEERIRREAAHTDALLHVARALNADLNLDKVIQTVCEEARRVMNVPLAAVSLLDGEQGVLRFAGGSGLPPELAAQLRSVPLANYDQRHPSADGIVIVPDVQALPDLLNAPVFRALNMRTTANVMLMLDRDPIGTLTVSTVGQVRTFDEADLKLLRGLADQSALAIQNARLFQSVTVQRERLRVLSARLVEAQEVERRRIARELHDDVGQLLTGLQLTLATIGRGLPDAPPAGLTEAQQIVVQLMDRAQDLSLELRPAILDHLGLVPALVWHFERYTRQTGVQVRFEQLGADQRFASAVETAVFRIVQEALTNVARHAGAREVGVSLWLDEGTLGAQIDDEGSGFDLKAALANHASIGLSGMEERAGLLGGQLTIESAPGAGTQISVEIPLSGWLERRQNERDDSVG